VITLLATLLSGAMFHLSQGIDNAWPLAWFAPVPLLWLAYGRARTWQIILAALGAILAGAIYIWQCYSMAPPLILIQVVNMHLTAYDLSAILLACGGPSSSSLKSRRNSAPFPKPSRTSYWPMPSCSSNLAPS
jgi:apolipoprotein N-acyltransferase